MPLWYIPARKIFRVTINYSAGYSERNHTSPLTRNSVTYCKPDVFCGRVLIKIPSSLKLNPAGVQFQEKDDFK
jgi:hypothetical protein